jgi:aconitate hydratase
MDKRLVVNNWPRKIEVGLIGSCTNSSYEDISRAASIAKEAVKKGLKSKAKFTITPGSEQVRKTIERDGYIKIFEELGASVFSNACGPCIGQWARPGAEKKENNSIIHSFNRNFAKRADGNPNTHAFVASPEIVTAIAIAGDLGFNPLKQTLKNDEGKEIFFEAPKGHELPLEGFSFDDNGYKTPLEDGANVQVKVNTNSKRLQLLEPFKSWSGNNLRDMRLLIKTKGKCTTDHISMAGPWLKYRGHLDNISENMLTGAINYFNDKSNYVKNLITNEYGPVPTIQRFYKKKNIDTIVVGDENYGEGSSREHAAMEPRHLGVRVVLVRSFARIHETNLKKQGMLGLTFSDKNDYNKIFEDDYFEFLNLNKFSPGKQLKLKVKHKSGEEDIIKCNHTYNDIQIKWFKAGSALNLIRKNM